MLTEELRSVLRALNEEDLTAAGVPKLDAIKKAWVDLFPDAGALEMSADGRDEIWSEFQAERSNLNEGDAQAEGAPAMEGHQVKLVRTATNPLKLMVNGKTLASIQEGETVTLSDAAYAQFCMAPGIEYEEG